jgi:hypothetical protein
MSFSLRGKRVQSFQDRETERAMLDAGRKKASIHLIERSLAESASDCKELSGNANAAGV